MSKTRVATNTTHPRKKIMDKGHWSPNTLDVESRTGRASRCREATILATVEHSRKLVMFVVNHVLETPKIFQPKKILAALSLLLPVFPCRRAAPLWIPITLPLKNLIMTNITAKSQKAIRPMENLLKISSLSPTSSLNGGKYANRWPASRAHPWQRKPQSPGRFPSGRRWKRASTSFRRPRRRAPPCDTFVSPRCLMSGQGSPSSLPAGR
mmetsp:Transcript_28119/g.66795  ORF Transcript_28119/g.66795 Transcript_28119/m.66795 type:complete len:210 (+) Transcript_28119:429-1058(+)